ncbi:Gamma-glutamyl phosphate reductase 2 [Halomicronema hongdechloris C2206]|uniref:Gamma-glutamyl phosphate reductase n=1 Tax=Halomicronema hongdechloris C2206 TaxID=1641165 RepID=A0A1Z3HSU5_9CYAN|nr:gamma-glutamyl-phosphate reductase [Halomicronema hongdechloris]ASC73346.1 Gamma-glutamyl phosphate reductase 2 [Halomicronema hongdechloris C2206]
MASSQSSFEFSQILEQVRQASHALALAGCEHQSHALDCMAHGLDSAQDTILEANTLDLEASLEMAVPELVLDWLKLTPERLQHTIKILRRLAALGDPRPLLQSPMPRLSQTATGYTQVTPLGVVALVYEALPELAAIAAGLCIRTGNGLVLKGGNEASQTNQAIIQVLQQEIDRAGLNHQCLWPLTTDQGDAARTWLMQARGIDLLIPYGRPTLIQQVMRHATVPVLPIAMGNCYLYWAASGAEKQVGDLIVDSHKGSPDAVNAIEKVLIHESHDGASLQRLWQYLQTYGFSLRGDDAMAATYPELTAMESGEWSQPYLSHTVAFQRVVDVAQAVDVINHQSSGHANCLVSESYREAHYFSQHLQSTAIYINTSPRFTRNPVQAAGIALGMTAQRGRGKGFIGLEALMTAKHIMQGTIVP